MPAAEVVDTAEVRKARGAFFTPEPIADFIARWALREADDTVLEPSAGDAAFMVQAVRQLRQLGATGAPRVDGVEIHPASARVAEARVRNAGGTPSVAVKDFFLVEPAPSYSAVIGNPPFIRYQDFQGEPRRRSQVAALKAGVSLTALASSWAAFTVQASLFLRPGGRLGLVLPAELLSVNYAGAVRRFLLDRFASVELVLFEEQIFPGAEADVVLLLADGYGEGPTAHASIHQARDAHDLAAMAAPTVWRPQDPAAKWTGLLLARESAGLLEDLETADVLAPLQRWGETTLGMVTGNNSYFALTPERVAELGLPRRELLPLSPPGSTHLRGLDVTRAQLAALGRKGRSNWLFRPGDRPSTAALAYIEAGHLAGVDQAYKCRVRSPWYRVPLLPPPDLFLTCMNADTPRLTTNDAAAHHLNSVHGVYLSGGDDELGRELLPLAALNSATMLSAEVVGRSYGGGVLKLEPREADVWAVPSPDHVRRSADRLRGVRARVAEHLAAGELQRAVELVDQALLIDTGALTTAELGPLAADRAALAHRRANRGRSGR